MDDEFRVALVDGSGSSSIWFWSSKFRDDDESEGPLTPAVLPVLLLLFFIFANIDCMSPLWDEGACWDFVIAAALLVELFSKAGEEREVSDLDLLKFCTGFIGNPREPDILASFSSKVSCRFKLLEKDGVFSV